MSDRHAAHPDRTRRMKYLFVLLVVPLAAAAQLSPVRGGIKWMRATVI
jgi:hypothetical protein